MQEAEFGGYNPNARAEGPMPLWQRTIEIEDLLLDNASPESQRRIEQTLKDQEGDDEKVVARCADARYWLTWEGNTTIPTVATGGPRPRYRKRFQRDCVSGIVELPHLNCGGLRVREGQIVNGVAENATDSYGFVARHVPESDPGRMALRSAAEVSLLVAKPVLAAVHNHDTGDINPLAVYRNGKPDYSRELSDSFQKFLNDNATYVASIKKTFYEIDQSVQSPRVLHFTTSDLSSEALFAGITERPGNVFRVSTPEPEDEDARKVDPVDANLSIDQSHYAISHSITSFGKPGTEFERLDRVIVEAKTMNAARDMASRFKSRDWAKDWLALPDKKIFIVRVVDGQLVDTDYF